MYNYDERYKSRDSGIVFQPPGARWSTDIGLYYNIIIYLIYCIHNNSPCNIYVYLCSRGGDGRDRIRSYYCVTPPSDMYLYNIFAHKCSFNGCSCYCTRLMLFLIWYSCILGYEIIKLRHLVWTDAISMFGKVPNRNGSSSNRRHWPAGENIISYSVFFFAKTTVQLTRMPLRLSIVLSIITIYSIYQQRVNY